ncbi:MAG: polysaccharide pyruvyl transferase family protein [Ardenticatenaceae bacterium]|nr:polysaccharide pyruvyl transferase family protein [Ardenticatenaceae bacterium]
MPVQKSVKKIGIMGFFGYGNLGDAAVQETVLQRIREYVPDAEIFGFSLNPSDTEARHGIKSFPITRMNSDSAAMDSKSSNGLSRIGNWFKFHPNPRLRTLERWVMRLPIELSLIMDAYKNLSGFDALIVSGSGPLQDYWAGGGPFSAPYTLLKWGIIAKSHRTKFLFISVGAGPIRAPLSKTFFKYALSLADYRSFRDKFSKELIQSIGLNKNDPIYPDQGWGLEVKNQSCSQVETKRQIVGIGPMGYFREGCWPESDEAKYAYYLEKMAAFVLWLLDKEYAIMFLPGEVHFDQLVISDLIEVIRQKGEPELEQFLLRPTILTVDDLMANLKVVDFVVASRFHNILLSQLINKPVLAISYQEKIEDLMTEVGQNDYFEKIGQFEVETLKEKFSSLEINREEILNNVAHKAREYQASLKEQYKKVFQLI